MPAASLRFDYGEFRSIAELAASSANYETFGFVFDDAGIYVFTSSCDTQSIFVLVVMPTDVRWVSPPQNEALMSREKGFGPQIHELPPDCSRDYSALANTCHCGCHLVIPTCIFKIFIERFAVKPRSKDAPRRGVSFPSCTTDAHFVPLTGSNLILLGVTKNSDDLTLSPDWMLIGGLLSGVAAMILG